MAHKQIRPKTKCYGIIQRGCSLTIPVIITDPFDKPIDLTGTEVAFTVKRRREDFDMDDSRAYITKNFAPQEPENGRFSVQLSSKDTDFEPGCFYFDIELTKTDGMVYRICTLEFILEGGPTNRTINEGLGQFPIGDQITIVTLEQGAPIVVVAPTVDVSAEIYSQVADMQNTIESHTAQIETIENQVVTMQEEIEKLKEQEGGDDTRLTEIEGNLEIAQNNIEVLTNDLQTVQTNLQNLEGKVTQNEEDVEDLRDEITALDTKVSGYDTDIVQLKSDIVTINSTINDIQTSINSLENDLTALEGTVSSLTTDIDNTKGDISTLQTDMINTKSDISTLEEDISNLASDISQAQSDATLAKTTADTAQADASNALNTVQTVQGELTQTQQDLGIIEADLETAKTNIQTNTNDITQLKSDIAAIDGMSEAPDDGLIYGRLSEAWSEITGTLVKAGYTPTLFTTDSDSIADFLKAAESYAASVATPFARFIKRTGGPIVQWTSPTTFIFTGGTYIQMSTRGQIRTISFSQQSLNYSGGVFICFNNSTQTLVTFDMVNILTLPTNYYIVGWMLTSPNGNPSVHVIDGGDYEYISITDHSVLGDISTIGDMIELDITETIFSRLTSTGTNTCRLEIVGTTTINNVDIRRMSQYGDSSEGSTFNGITLTTAGVVVDDTIYMDSSDGGRVWICNGNIWYEMIFFVSGGGTRARIVAHKLN